MNTRDSFLKLVRETSERITRPAQVLILSRERRRNPRRPTLSSPARKRTYNEAIDLLSRSAERDGAKMGTNYFQHTQPEQAARDKGLGFFTEGDNQTGEWKEQKGFFWTGEFWVGELWRLYEQDERRAIPSLGRAVERAAARQREDRRTTTPASSITTRRCLAYRQTKDAKYRDGGLRAAARLKQLYNPTTELVAAWAVSGDDTIIDTMMNLQIWWWARGKRTIRSGASWD